ncbi:hypothetical protein TTHT_2084 [Thermotomaculum hydrothermale]|uniref:Carbohydrate-binding domain-containing protein n=1 Tax=Thermotomaculum hydrothermale TaxID=981385 RepID=A0A7R6PVR0_9BACT|nr:hypothetical protein [Thermotomaculum hydrothermale]BBB33522.1 hypothetical protein TTHT_2084 [Thermotomaculum hydrothermale]
MKRLLAIGLLFLFYSLSYSKIISVNIPYIPDGKIKLDGIVNEDIYKKAFHWDKFVQTRPGDNIKPSQKTEMFMFHNGKELIIAFICYDTHPENIKRIRRRRDNVWGDIDSIDICINTFGDGKQYYDFAISAMNDVSDDLSDYVNGGSQDIDIVFEHKTHFFDKGWSVEVIIPFSSINLKADKNGNAKWYFDAQRHIPRKFHETISTLPYNRDANDITDGEMILNLDHIQEIGEKKKLKLIPEVVASYSKNKNMWNKKETHSFEKMTIGLTGEYDFSENTVAKFTIHPDFSQIEADDVYQEINNRYPVYFKEKRPFFMDGMESFSSPINLVYTRNIVKPEYGLKFTTKNKHTSLAVLSAMEKDVPAERFDLIGNSKDVYWNVLRGTYNFSPGNYIGGFYILRNFGSYFNQAISIDGANQIKKWNLSYQAVATSLKEESSTKHGAAGSFSISYKWNRYFRSNINYSFLSPDYFNDMGFITTNNIRSFGMGQNFNYSPETDKGLIKGFSLGGYYDMQYYYNNSKFYSNSTSLWCFIRLTGRIQIFSNAYTENEEYKGTIYPVNFKNIGIYWGEHDKFQPWFNIGRGTSILYGNNPQLADQKSYHVGISSDFSSFQFRLSLSFYTFNDKQTGAFIRKQRALQFNGEYFFTDRLSLKTMYQSVLPKYRDYQFKMPYHYFYLLITWQKDAYRKIYAGITNSTLTMNTIDNDFIGYNNDKVAFAKLSWLF